MQLEKTPIAFLYVIAPTINATLIVGANCQVNEKNYIYHYVKYAQEILDKNNLKNFKK